MCSWAAAVLAWAGDGDHRGRVGWEGGVGWDRRRGVGRKVGKIKIRYSTQLIFCLAPQVHPLRLPVFNDLADPQPPPPPAPPPPVTMASIPNAATTESSNPKRPAADAIAFLACGSPAFDNGAGKRRRTVVPAAALTAKIAALEAAVASGKAREAAQDRRIAALETQNKRVAELEADNASLTAEVAELRNAPAPDPAAR